MINTTEQTTDILREQPLRLKRSFRSQYPIDHVLDAWRRAGGLFDDFPDEFLDSGDLCSEPKNGRTVPVAVGTKRLAEQILGSPSAALLTQAIERSPYKLVSDAAILHETVLRGDKQISIETIQAVWLNNKRLDYDYIRLLLPLTLHDQRVLVYSYAKLLSERTSPQVTTSFNELPATVQT